MPKRNKEGLFEFQGTAWEYTWVYNGVRKYANFSQRQGLIVAEEN